MQCHGLLDQLNWGDKIMADKEPVTARGIFVNVPPKLESNGKQMLALDVKNVR